MTSAEPVEPVEAAQYFRPPALDGVEALHATFVAHRYAPHVHDTWVVALVDDGAAGFELDAQPHTARSGSVFVIPPGAVHTGESASAGGYTYRVLYLEPTWHSDDDELSLPKPRRRTLSPVARDAHLARTLDAFHNSIARRGRALEHGQTVASLGQVLRQALQLRDRPSATGSHGAVRRARELIHERWREDFTLPELADAAGLSPYHLLRLFQRQVGMSPAAYRRALRVQAARRMLQRGRAPADVAVACGFYDQSHLNRHFKAVTGVTPSRYATAT